MGAELTHSVRYCSRILPVSEDYSLETPIPSSGRCTQCTAAEFVAFPVTINETMFSTREGHEQSRPCKSPTGSSIRWGFGITNGTPSEN
jgi:hypothetical protein